MGSERDRRKWLIVAGTSFFIWAFAIAGIVALVEGGEISAQAIVSLVLAAVMAIIGVYASRALMKLPTPTGRVAELLGLVLYSFYLYIAVILVAGILPWIINIPDLATFPAGSWLRVAGTDTTIMGIAVLAAFVVWHRAYLREIKSFGA